MRNLIGRLLERPPTDLDRIAAFWGARLNGRDRYSDVAAIYREMTDIWAARDTWPRLAAIEQAIVMRMATGPDAPVDPESLADQLGTSAATVTDALRNLYRYGIVALEQTSDDEFDDLPRLYLPREIGSLFERRAAEEQEPLDLELPLGELLATLPYIDIEEAASLWGARVTPGVHARADLINIIRSQLERPERVAQAVNGLSPGPAALWQTLRTSSGAQPLTAIQQQTNLEGLPFRDAARELTNRLLIWHRYVATDNGVVERWLQIPESILHPQVPDPEPVPEIVRYDGADIFEPAWLFPQAAAWDLLTILREATRDSPRTSALRSGDPSIQRRIANRLWRAELESGALPTGYVPFLAHIGALLGVLQDYDGRTVAGVEAERWRDAAFTTAARRMVAAWTSAEEWIEGRERIELSLYGASWPAYRGMLLRALAELNDDGWYDQESFIEHLLVVEPDLLRQAEVGSTPSSQLTMRVDPARRPSERRADVLRLVIATTLDTACNWLGIIERAQTMDGGKATFRVTSFGRWIGGRAPEPAGQHLGPAPLAVGANLQILLYRPTPRRVWALTAFADLRALDRVSTFQLTSSAVIRALASHVEIRDIVRFLEGQSGQELPQTVRYTLEEWDSGYHRVWMQRAIVLTPEDDADLDELVRVLASAGLSATPLENGMLALLHNAGDATERIFDQATRALRERGFAPLARAPEARRR